MESELKKYIKKNKIKGNPYPYPPTHFLIDGEMVNCNDVERKNGELVVRGGTVKDLSPIIFKKEDLCRNNNGGF